MTFYLGNSYLYPIASTSLDVIRYHIYRQLSQEFHDYAFFTRFLLQIGTHGTISQNLSIFCKMYETKSSFLRSILADIAQNVYETFLL